MDTLWFEFWKTKILIALLFKAGWEDIPPLLCSWIKWWWSRELASLINIGFKNENLATSSRHLLYFPGGLIIIDHNQLCGGMDGTHCGSITKWIPISPKKSYHNNSDRTLVNICFDLSLGITKRIINLTRQNFRSCHVVHLVVLFSDGVDWRSN